jgi:hypothetical protein
VGGCTPLGGATPSEFGEALRQLRQERGLSLRALARRTNYDFGYIGQLERGERNAGSAKVVKLFDDALEGNGRLSAAFLQSGHALGSVEQQPTPAHTQALVTLDMPKLASSLDLGRDDMLRRGFLISSALALGAALAPTLNDLPEAAPQARLVSLTGPAGRLFAGSSVPAMVLPSAGRERVMVDIPIQRGMSHFIRRPEHTLVVGQAGSGDHARLYAADTRHVRSKLRHHDDTVRLPIPNAYVLDELTLGLIWAIANLDDSLLDDDAELYAAHSHLAELDKLNRSAAGRDLVAGLTPLSQAWLGSDFCARHITRNSAALSETPIFWTCEQRGEEVSGWLFFAHKFEYLKASTRGLDDSSTDKPTRAFCIPPEAVTTSGAPERMLLLLSAALMESFGIKIQVCTDEDYTQVEGFVSDGRKAILANWVDSDSLWHVDVTNQRSALTGFDDAAQYALAHSVTAGASPQDRLKAFAGYLQLDWPTTIRRCAELGRYGLEGLMAPRSRLLSVAGAERACQFVGRLA